MKKLGFINSLFLKASGIQMSENNLPLPSAPASSPTAHHYSETWQLFDLDNLSK